MIDANDVEPLPDDDDDEQPTLPSDDYGAEIEYPGPEAPFNVAEQLYKKFRAGPRTLRSWRGGWMFWHVTHWSELDTSHLRGHVYQELSGAWYWKATKEGPEKAKWNPNRHKVSDVLDAMQAHGYLPLEVDPPSWLSTSAVGAGTLASQTISCQNGLLDLNTRDTNPHTPAFFNLVTVPLAYQADATAPKWLAFLDSLWPDDPESVALLQEYMGYVLSGRTDLQKMLVMVGPIRSGKGTIARVLVQLLGRGHVCGPTLASLATNFGLAPLLGKPLAIISDARLGNMPGHVVVERLLSITGEDMLTVDRKYREQWSGKLPTRFVILTNELPKFRDSSGAIASRMLILQMVNSFYGRENLDLDDQLRAELPGILNWTLDGLARLGRFTTPASSDNAVRLMADLASPLSAFVRDECDVSGPAAEIPCDNLYAAWSRWANDNGHHPGSKSSFGRDLHSVFPRVKVIRPGTGSSRERKYVGIKLIGQPS